jgi:hypothetical protein
MLAIAKNFAYLEIALAMGWAIYFFVLSNQSKKLTGHFPFIVVSAFNGAMFFSPNHAIAHLLFFVLPLALGRTKNSLLIVMVVGCFCTPALAVHLNAAGIDLFSWTMQATLGLGGLAALAAAKPDRDSEPGRWNIPLAAFLVLLTIIAIRGTSPTNWIRQTLSIVTAYGIPVLVIGHCLRTVANRRTFLLTLAGVGSMLAVVLSYEARVHWPLYTALDTKFHILQSGLTVKFREGAMRAYGPLDEATAAGFALVIAFAAALACHREFRSGPARYAVPALIGLGILAPQSRGGMIGAVVVLLCYAFYRYGTAGLAKTVAFLTPLAAAYLLRASSKTAAVTDAQDTADYRQQLFTRGMQEFWKSPVVGETMDRVTAHMEDMRQGEGIIDFVNSYLYFGLALGAIGVVLFCIVLYYPAARLYLQRARLNRHIPTGTFAGFAFGSLIAAGVMLAFTSIPQRPIIVTLVIAGTSLGLRPPRRLSRETTSNPTTPGDPLQNLVLGTTSPKSRGL